MCKNEEIKKRVNDYQKEIDNLFKEWKKDLLNEGIYKNGENDKANVFISDGIVSPESWFNQDIRPLFILKEAYGGKEDWNEAKWLNGEKDHKSMAKTWKSICKWTNYLFAADSNSALNWSDPNIKKIAVMNIKKYGGTKRSDWEDLKKHAEEHYNHIYSEIALIDPTIIICGYTGWLLDIVWEKQFENKARVNGSGRVYSISINDKDVPLVDFWHPACRQDHFEDFKKDINVINEKNRSTGESPIQLPEPDDSENESKESF